jgi:outer membrane cobalamin receptor
MAKTFLTACAFLLCSISAGAQDLDSLLNLSAFTAESDLQKVLNQNLTVSSSKAMTTRETPGIISLITAEEIENSGARDLIDVLRLVPGFDVAQDIGFVVGIGLRGSWSHEGKVLVMLDGQPFNDLLYQNVPLGNHFSVDAIQRIEIIRGPGSAIYGGSAEYGVINIITKGAEKLHGLRVYGTTGFTSQATARTNAGITIAHKTDEADYDLSVFKGRGIVSDRKYNELYGDTVNVDLAESSKANPLNINAGIRIHNFSARVMYDQFRTNDPYTKIYFDQLSYDVKYNLKASSKITITPHLRFSNQLPWQYRNASTDEVEFKVRAKRYQSALSMNYDITRKVNLNTGVVYFTDKGFDLLNGGYFQGKNSISFNNFAVFAQALLKQRLANTTFGVRYERNSHYGHALVPRIALTKKIENFHFKILFSQAFRAPAIDNINLALDPEKIKPEKSSMAELELGYQFTPEMLLAVNLFDANTKNVIVYATSIDNPEGFYENFSRTGSSGFEVVYSIRKKKWYSNLTYSFSQADRKNTIASYAIDGNKKQFVGFANHKVTMNTNINLTNSLTFNPTVMFSGDRFAYTGVTTVDEDNDGIADIDEDENEILIPALGKLPEYTLVNAFLNYKNRVNGLTIGIGIYDILSERPVIPQAYNGDFAPIPGRSREYILKLSYQMDFKK